jgi:hypothetical protein
MNPPKWLIYTLIVIALILAVGTITFVTLFATEAIPPANSTSSHTYITSTGSMWVEPPVVSPPPITSKLIMAHINKYKVPFKQVIETKYFTDLPKSTPVTAKNTQQQAAGGITHYKEYALVTVDSEAFYHDVNDTEQFSFRLKGKDYTAHMEITHEIVFDDNTWGKDYTGTITDAKNKPVNGTVKLSFSGYTTTSGELIDPDDVSGGITIWSNSPSEETYNIEYAWIRDDNKRAYIVYNPAKSFEPATGEWGTALWKLARDNPNSTDPEIIPPTHPTPKPTSHFVNVIKSVQYPTPTPAPTATTNTPNGKQSQQSENDIERIKPMGATSDTTQTINFLVAYDTEFVNLGAQPAKRAETILNNAKPAFTTARVDFNIIQYYYAYGLTKTDSFGLLNEFIETVQNDRDRYNSDMGFLFTGKNLDDLVIGKSCEYNGDSGQAYGLTQMINEGETYKGKDNADHRKIVTAHELGHIFNANHDNAYSWTESGSKKYTIMQAEWQGDNQRLEFSSSTNHGDSTHNNIQRIKDVKATVAGFQ